MYASKKSPHQKTINNQRSDILLSHKKRNIMKAYIFPGQGSQSRGMGNHLFKKFPEILNKANNILGYDIQELCAIDPYKHLNKTQYTQPAIYVVNTMMYLDKKRDNPTPDYLAGHSLGEYNALLAASVFDFETGLKLVRRRAEIMSKAQNGGMAALIGMGKDEIKTILNDFQFNSIDIANYNSVDQVVISGKQEDIANAQKVFEANGIKLYYVLNVSGAFHSRYMKDARLEFDSFLQQFQFSPLRTPVISNVSAREYKDAEIKDLLVSQIDNPVKWYDSISYLIHLGVTDFIEVGPGDVLTKMVGYIQENPLNIEDKPVMIKSKKKIMNESLISDMKMNGVESRKITPETLGSEEFRKEYGVKYAYASGSMYRGIASKDLVLRMAKSNLLSFFGTGGLSLSEIEEAIVCIKKELPDGNTFGMNLLHNLYAPDKEMEIVSLYLSLGIRYIEASAYMGCTQAIAYYRIKGLEKVGNEIVANNKIMAKISRPEVAEVFMSPIPDYIIKKLLDESMISNEEADLAKHIALADDVCAEADSAGHTDQASAFTLFPVILRLRNRMMEKYRFQKKLRVGAAGGIGVAESAAAAFLLGVDFILTGSINQCSVQSGMSDSVKDLLQTMSVQDTDYVPAGDMFELGAKVQVLKKGLFFPARAKRLRELYKQHDCLEDISEKDRKQIQERYFQKTFDAVFEEIKTRKGENSEEIAKAKSDPKHKMALIFRWYFGYSMHLALNGDKSKKVDYQVHCGPALGAFNEWVKGTEVESWKNRNVDEMADKIMSGAADCLLNI